MFEAKTHGKSSLSQSEKQLREIKWRSSEVMEKDISEHEGSEEKDTIKIATIAAVAKAIKDNAGHRQFRYNGKEDNN